ncbi:hypothetical protein AB6A40_006014 [Gnathostoma spinigerum]|uniref:Bestrophin homolog n=1 Tax=Gnathostoma spinigerum TaxID=75299 RepID=A0ABD6ESS4_9BILA
MTVTYSGNFIRLLARWKGSIWRSVWRELLVYLVLYYAVHFVYHGVPYFLDTEDGLNYKKTFERVASMFDTYTKQIPLTFLLGFYVANVVSRWWRQFETLPWPEDLLSIVCTIIPGEDDVSRRRRNTIARYVNLTSAMAWRNISSKIRQRFPTVRDLVSCGMMTEKEFSIMESIEEEYVHWMTPLQWIQDLIMTEVKEHSPLASLVNQAIYDLKSYRKSLRKLFCYDWVSVPLVYTQVAALATYTFFGFCLIGRQSVHSAENGFHIPIFTIVQFLFFVGWFKVGQDLMRPFGLDDDDIELDYIFDRNIATSFAIVNKVHLLNPNHPEIEDDIFWRNRDGVCPVISHFEKSNNFKQHPPRTHLSVREHIGRDVEERPLRCAAILKRWSSTRDVKW